MLIIELNAYGKDREVSCRAGESNSDPGTAPRRRLFEHPIPFEVAEAIVYLMEAVEVDHNKRDGEAVTARPGPFTLDQLGQVAPIVDPGERVADAQLPEPLAVAHPREGQLDLRHEGPQLLGILLGESSRLCSTADAHDGDDLILAAIPNGHHDRRSGKRLPRHLLNLAQHRTLVRGDASDQQGLAGAPHHPRKIILAQSDLFE